MTPPADYGYHSATATWAQSYLAPQVTRLLGGTGNGPVLDLGCGNGSLARTLLAQGHDVYGVDASESGIDIANAQTPGRFFVLDLNTTSLPAELADRRFNTVISTEVIEHLYDPRALLASARRALAPGGRLILSTPYHGYLKNVALALSGKLDGHFTVLWDGGHIKFFSRATLTQLLRQEGFEVTAFAGAGRMPWLWKSMVLCANML